MDERAGIAGRDAVVEALAEIASEPLELVDRVLRLDPFSNRRQSEIAAQPDDRLEDLAAFVALRHREDERTVDLERVERQFANP